MVGSAHDAEDLVQETYLRAWRSYAGFEGRASMRSWLYAIATNVCLTALEPRRIRVLPSGLGGPDDGPDRPPTQVAPGEVSWLGPLPDRWIAPAAEDPAATVVARESVRLALIASLQHLPARQRAILILRDVLAFSAAETAEILGTTTTAVKSGLQRARARMDELDPAPDELLEPTDRRARALLEGYIAAFERSDAGLLEQVLRMDATLEATPFRHGRPAGSTASACSTPTCWGRRATGGWSRRPPTASPPPPSITATLTGALRAHGIVVLAATAGGISPRRRVPRSGAGGVFGF